MPWNFFYKESGLMKTEIDSLGNGFHVIISMLFNRMEYHI